MVQNTAAELASLLRAAGSAHGVYETNELGGVYDQHWPTWYAAWLLDHRVNELLGSQPTTEALAVLLKDCDAAYKQAHPTEAWPSFYARRLLANQ